MKLPFSKLPKNLGIAFNYTVKLSGLDGVNFFGGYLPAKGINFEQLGEVEYVTLKLASGHELQLPKRWVMPRSIEVTLYDSDSKVIRKALMDYYSKSGLKFSKAPKLSELKKFTLLLSIKQYFGKENKEVYVGSYFVVPTTGFIMSLGQELALDENELTFMVLGQNE